ncbi:hypothetical protein U8Y98_27475 [Priestia megaterium]|uniref:hypothetical protein n=1 Tax=Priestia megaterium TaxID=1404 RepID=UPI002FDF8466
MLELKGIENYFKTRINENSIDILKSWDIFKEFSLENIECIEAALIFECGKHPNDMKETFYVQFSRQFTRVDKSYNPYREKVILEFLFDSTDELSNLEFSLIHLEENKRAIQNFFEDVENLYEFEEILKAVPRKQNILFEKN